MKGVFLSSAPPGPDGTQEESPALTSSAPVAEGGSRKGRGNLPVQSTCSVDGETEAHWLETVSPELQSKFVLTARALTPSPSPGFEFGPGFSGTVRQVNRRRQQVPWDKLA